MPRPDPTLFDCLQAIFNILAGVAEVDALPSAYAQRSAWEEQRDTLAIPAAWRRKRRVT
jgi:hypothetical protein